ncbi:MAG: hypothetical protein D3924_15735, partial [Candidatus Electrothrix sp. AR4]|nr:hypothetical protein [Candidatus Electrothrix sp. AR4]
MNRKSTVSRNTRLSLSTAGDETVAVSVKGEIKLLECDPAILERVLNIADKEGTVEGIIQHFAEEFSAEDVFLFLESLTKAGLLIISAEETTEAWQDVPPPVLLGEGKLAQAVQQALGDELVQLPLGSSPEKMEIFAQGTVFIVCPEQADFNSLLELNNFFIQHRYPYILCYFDGEQVAAGPSVLPGLTPCLSCYLEHRRAGLEQTIDNEFSWQSLGELSAAWPLPENSQWDISASWAAELIVSELKRLRTGGENPELSGIQSLFSRPSSSANTSVSFEPISTCPSCH